MAACRITSADSHFVEPPKMWAERIDKKFKETFGGLSSEEDWRKTVHDTAARLYGITD